MKHLTRLLAGLAALAAVALGTGACNLQWSPYAARVGTRVISPSQLDGALSSAGGDPAFRCLLQSANGAGFRVKGAGSDTYDSGFVSFVLTNLIDTQVASSVVLDRHLAEPSSARSLASSQIHQAFSSELAQAHCAGSAKQLVAKLGAPLYNSFLDLQLAEDALAARAAHLTLSTTGIIRYESAHPAATRESCVSGIVVKSKGTATHVETLLSGGAKFTSLVAKYSIDKGQPGGALGCYTAAGFSQAGAAVALAVERTSIGSVTSPVSYQGDYLIMLVTSRPFEPPVDLLDQVFSEHAKAFTSAISATVGRTSVQVNPAYGRWVSGSPRATSSLAGFGGRVEPGKGPAAAFLLNKSATRGPLSSSSSPLGSGAG